MTVNDGVAQVLTRLAESLDSPIAELPTGDGPADAPEISSANQIIFFLDEGQKLLARTPILEIRGGATISGVSIGEYRWTHNEATTDPVDRVLWRAESAAWTPTGGTPYPLEINDGRFFPIHHPNPLTEARARPRRIYDTGLNLLIGPRPNVAGAIALTGLLLPKTLVAGGDFDDVPEEKIHHVVSFACWRVCQRNVVEPAYAAALPLWQNEISWAAPFLGLGA